MTARATMTRRAAKGLATLASASPIRYIAAGYVERCVLFRSARLTEQERAVVDRALAKCRGFFELRACYANAKRLARADRTAKLVYVEGLATAPSGKPYPHAWAAIGGKVVDVTSLDGVGEPEPEAVTTARIAKLRDELLPIQRDPVRRRNVERAGGNVSDLSDASLRRRLTFVPWRVFGVLPAGVSYFGYPMPREEALRKRDGCSLNWNAWAALAGAMTEDGDR